MGGANLRSSPQLDAERPVALPCLPLVLSAAVEGAATLATLEAALGTTDFAQLHPAQNDAVAGPQPQAASGSVRQPVNGPAVDVGGPVVVEVADISDGTHHSKQH